MADKPGRRKLQAKQVFDLDGFSSVQAVKQIRITTSASEVGTGVHLKQCWTVLLEVGMKTDMQFHAPLVKAGTLPAQGGALMLPYGKDRCSSQTGAGLSSCHITPAWGSDQDGEALASLMTLQPRVCEPLLRIALR